MKYILITLAIAFSFLLGTAIGVRHYKASCELIGTTPKAAEWRECSL